VDLIALDFETRWGGDYTLSKMSTEAYVRDLRFHAHGVGIKINDGRTQWYPDEEAILVLACLDIENSAVLAHHAHFDGFILSHQFNRRPKLWFDTLSMGRALHGVEIGLGLGKLAEYYGVGVKNTAALMETKGLERLTPEISKRTGVYCCNDVDMTYELFNKMRVKFPRTELNIIDMVVRMFTEPVLNLDGEMLAEYLEEIQAGKLALLLEAGISKDDLMSNPKFAQVLQNMGIRPPQKISLATGKMTWAFAKTDPEMKALAEHPDPQVQAIVAARTGTKSTIAESRCANFLAMSSRGAAPVYLKYSGAAQTHRLCLTGDTVITVMRAGVVLDIKLLELDSRDLVWDSEAFVPHGGLLDQGEHEVMTYQGVTGTPDHRVYCDEISEAIELRTASERGYTLKAAASPSR